MRIIFDSCSLITAGKFSVDHRPIINHLTQAGLVIHIPETVKTEVVDDGLQAGHQDAFVIQRPIHHGLIHVEQVHPPSPEMSEILDDYGVRKGDRDFIYLAQQISCDCVITDDFLLLLICHRFELPVKMFPDLVELLVQQAIWTTDTGRKALHAIRARYRRGFIEHSLRRINKP